MSKTQSVPVRPLSGRILIHVAKKEEKTAGGLFIPQTANKDGQTQKGKVVASGGGAWHENGSRRDAEVKIGDTVIFGSYAGVKLEFDGEDHVVLREEDIIGVLN